MGYVTYLSEITHHNKRLKGHFLSRLTCVICQWTIPGTAMYANIIVPNMVASPAKNNVRGIPWIIILKAVKTQTLKQELIF